MAYSGILQKKQGYEIDIKDIYIKTQIEILLNNWCVQKTNNEYLFLKHFNSNKKGLIYQLILSGNDYDGIYEFEIFGHDLKIKNILCDGEIIMQIKSRSNCTLAVFEKENSKLSFSKKQYINQFFFIKDVLKYLYIFDTVSIETDKGLIDVNKNQIKESNFEKEVLNILNSEEIKFVHLIQDKKQYVISPIDLGEKSFKEELLSKKYVTPEEYSFFTSRNINSYSKIYKNMRKIQIY